MSETDVHDPEAGKGGGTEGPSPSKESEIAGLKAALQAVRERERDHKSEVEKLRAEMDALKQQPAKEYSRAELQQAVDDGRMSQNEADRILDRQQQRKLEQTVSERIEEESSKRELKARLEAEIGKYTSTYPEVLQDGTPLRERVAAEFERQRRLGKANSLQTELDALAVVLGPPETLSKGRDKPRETHQDVGSDGGEGDREESGTPKLPAHVKAHYDKMIGQRMYKGWDDPALKKELEQYGRW